MASSAGLRCRDRVSGPQTYNLWDFLNLNNAFFIQKKPERPNNSDEEPCVVLSQNGSKTYNIKVEEGESVELSLRINSNFFVHFFHEGETKDNVDDDGRPTDLTYLGYYDVYLLTANDGGLGKLQGPSSWELSVNISRDDFNTLEIKVVSRVSDSGALVVRPVELKIPLLVTKQNGHLTVNLDKARVSPDVRDFQSAFCRDRTDNARKRALKNEKRAQQIRSSHGDPANPPADLKAKGQANDKGIMVGSFGALGLEVKRMPEEDDSSEPNVQHSLNIGRNDDEDAWLSKMKHVELPAVIITPAPVTEPDISSRPLQSAAPVAEPDMSTQPGQTLVAVKRFAELLQSPEFGRPTAHRRRVRQDHPEDKADQELIKKGRRPGASQETAQQQSPVQSGPPQEQPRQMDIAAHAYWLSTYGKNQARANRQHEGPQLTLHEQNRYDLLRGYPNVSTFRPVGPYTISGPDAAPRVLPQSQHLSPPNQPPPPKRTRISIQDLLSGDTSSDPRSVEKQRLADVQEYLRRCARAQYQQRTPAVFNVQQAPHRPLMQLQRPVQQNPTYLSVQNPMYRQATRMPEAQMMPSPVQPTTAANIPLQRPAVHAMSTGPSRRQGRMPGAFTHQQPANPHGLNNQH